MRFAAQRGRCARQWYKSRGSRAPADAHRRMRTGERTLEDAHRRMYIGGRTPEDGKQIVFAGQRLFGEKEDVKAPAGRAGVFLLPGSIRLIA